jgi:hypothetical protein
MIGAARDAAMALAAAKWQEALVRVEDERDELAARGRHQLNQIKEIRWEGGGGYCMEPCLEVGWGCAGIVCLRGHMVSPVVACQTVVGGARGQARGHSESGQCGRCGTRAGGSSQGQVDSD